MRFTKQICFVLLACSLSVAHASMEEAHAAYDAGKYEQAYPLFKAEADKGDSYALFSMAVMQEEGQGVKADFAEALKLYQAAAQKGSPEAQALLGVMYYFGEQVEKSPVKGLAFLHAAAAQNHGNALYNLYLIESENGKQDQATVWLDKAVAAGYPRAQHRKASQYNFGKDGMPQDFTKANELYRLAAEQGFAQAQTDLALSYLYGEGVGKDEDEAHKWIMMAAKQDYAPAQLMAHNMYKNGIAVVKEEKEALRWLKKAAEGKNPEALFELASHYEYATLGLSRDMEKAWVLQQESASLDYARAQFYLGYTYFYGDTSLKIAQDRPKGLEWIRKAAEQNLNYAQVELAIILLGGEGAVADTQEAMDWLKKAGDYYGAQRTLGICYEKGIGVPADLKQAVVHYQKAAEQDDAQSQYNLALIYLTHEDLFGKQEKKAEELLQAAAKQDYQPAKEFLTTLNALKN